MLVSIGIVALMFIGSAVASTAYIDRFPEEVPTHWNLHGVADGHMSRDHTFMIFYLLPTVTAGLVALSVVFPWLSPQHFKVDEFRPTYDYVFAICTALFAWMHVVFLISAADSDLYGRWLTAGMFLFFALLGNVLGKVRKNFWMGVRTPWTLASDVVWEKTHRLAAWLFVAMGLAGFAAALAGLHVLLCFSLIMIAAVTSVIYSLVTYKRLEKAGGL